MDIISEYDGLTGIAVLREPTLDEIAQRKTDQADAQAAAAAQAALEADQAKARAAAIAHAKSLGFTDAMIAVMYPNLVEA
jgi:hypothetical protein